MPHRRDSVFIAQMVEAAEAALEFSDGHTVESFAGDRLVGYAVVRAALGIGDSRTTSRQALSIDQTPDFLAQVRELSG